LSIVSGDTALTLAAWSGQSDAMKTLIPISDLNNCEKEEGMSALYLAIAKNHIDCVRLLLDAGADINLVDHHGNTALLTAAMLTIGREILDMILGCGRSFDINAVGSKGRTAVHWAVGEPDSVKLLVENKLHLNSLDENKASPLLLAIAHHQPKAAEILIHAGCDINMVSITSHHTDDFCSEHLQTLTNIE
jgi:ankyrin repeat protein